MKDFLRQNGILLLVIAFLLSVLIGVLSFVMGGKADPLSNLVNTVTAPVRSGIAAAADWVEGVYGYVFHYGEMEQELKEGCFCIPPALLTAGRMSRSGSCSSFRPDGGS